MKLNNLEFKPFGTSTSISRNVAYKNLSGCMSLDNKNRLFLPNKRLVGYYFVDASRKQIHLITCADDILRFLESKFYTDTLKLRSDEFQTKGISSTLHYLFNIPKSKTTKYVQELTQKGLIKRVSQSVNCQTTCASCYEDGCDAEPRPPVNFWKVVKSINRQ